MRPTLLALTGIAAATTALIAAVAPASAAVRKCGPAVTSDIAQAENDLLGKRKALTSWAMKAAKLGGPAFANWRIADKKILGCKPGKTRADGVQCIAYANPCTIVQGAPINPRTPQTKPRGKRRIGGNVPFEI